MAGGKRMKKIRLEIPLDIWEEAIDNRIWLKIKNGRTEPCKDMKCTIPITKKGEKIVFEVEVPEKLNIIELVGLGGSTPVDDIATSWILESVDPNWRVTGLQQVLVLMENLTHEVPVINEKPDLAEWKKFSDEAEEGWLFLKRWAMVIYILEKQTIASFFWHPDLKNEYFAKTRELTLSKKHSLPCMWEQGGSYRDYGVATIICAQNGERKKTIFVKRKGKLACHKHALIVVSVNDIIVELAWEKTHLKILLNKIIFIDTENLRCQVESVAKYSRNGIHKIDKGEEIFTLSYWDNYEIASKYKDAVLAAYDKATCLQCKEPHYIYN